MLQIATSSFDTLKASTEPGELQADTHSPRLLFAEITTKRIRCDVLRSVGELKDAIRDYLDQHNADPKPFVWTKTAKAVLAKERRALEKLQSITGRSQPTVSEH
jgi:hypothetical protein